MLPIWSSGEFQFLNVEYLHNGAPMRHPTAADT
jgi:hypothetical protein